MCLQGWGNLVSLDVRRRGCAGDAILVGDVNAYHRRLCIALARLKKRHVLLAAIVLFYKYL